MKQVIVVRTDLNMRKGKMIAQGAHASLGVFSKTLAVCKTLVTKELVQAHISIEPQYVAWFQDGLSKKIVLGVASGEKLMELCLAASEAGLLHHLVVDEGLTEFKGQKTLTALAIGPGPEAEIDKITGELSLL